MFDKKTGVSLPINNAKSDEEELFFNPLIEEEVAWLKEEEGQLSVDVGETAEELVIIATMSGTKPDMIDLHLHNDLLTIRGVRTSPLPQNSNLIIGENYWGRFSRTIVLPTEVKAELTRAEYRNGLLIIYLPKNSSEKNIPIFVVEE